MTTCEDGPLLLRGRFELLTQDGQAIDPGRATVALCRCGRSASKPFCDGSHKATGWRASSEPDEPVEGPVRAGDAPGPAGETPDRVRDTPSLAGDTPDRTENASGEPAG